LNVSVISPAELAAMLTPARLDIAIKARFFRYLISGRDPDAERLYRWHIKARTGGVEPGGAKQSVDEYVAACRALLASMRRDGFDARHPIRIGSNSALRNGAHRLACALTLGLNVHVRHEDRPGRARAWDAVELRQQGLSETDLAHVKADWLKVTG
jgi:hypothetical protein